MGCGNYHSSGLNSRRDDRDASAQEMRLPTPPAALRPSTFEGRDGLDGMGREWGTIAIDQFA